ncbi:MAG: hypothetical protein ABSA76_06660 [Bacteroidales bacterium]
MTFDNSKTIISIRIKLFFATIILLGWVGVVYVAKLIKSPILGLDDSIWTLILVIIWLIIAFLPMILNYQFIFYSDDENDIVFRFFSAGIVGGKKNSVEINKGTFTGFKIESKYFGLSKSLILFQKLAQGVAKFPPIFISALTKDQQAKLIHALKQYAPQS